jgi:6-phospho-beta-glucosidase
MKLTVLGGGGVRIPALVRAVVGGRAAAGGPGAGGPGAGGAPGAIDQVDLFDPSPLRRDSIGRLSVELAASLGYPERVRVLADPEQALTGADYVFSAIRVGGDAARVTDEQVALERGLVGQETTGPGGCAMALRTIPVALGYCEMIARVAPRATLVNFTNPAGMITQAISSYGGVRAVGVCDTPSSTIAVLGRFLGAPAAEVTFAYGGLNHLGWISSLSVGGEERIDELVARYDELRAFDHRFTAFDPALVGRLGCIPTEYLYYYYEPAGYVAGVTRAGKTRGLDVQGFNERLIRGVLKGFESGGFDDAWHAYSDVMDERHGSYMKLDIDGRTDGSPPGAPAAEHEDADEIGGYEGVALSVIDGLSGTAPARVIVNTRNGPTLGFLAPSDVVEVPAVVDSGGVAPLAAPEVPLPARGLIEQMKEYERGVVEAAVTGDADLAAVSLAMHPLVPGLTVARDLIAAYRDRHGELLAYLR